MNDGRRVIWSNDLDYDDWKDDLEEKKNRKGKMQVPL